MDIKITFFKRYSGTWMLGARLIHKKDLFKQFPRTILVGEDLGTYTLNTPSKDLYKKIVKSIKKDIEKKIKEGYVILPIMGVKMPLKYMVKKPNKKKLKKYEKKYCKNNI